MVMATYINRSKWMSKQINDTHHQLISIRTAYGGVDVIYLENWKSEGKLNKDKNEPN